MKIEISIGELVDKVSILSIKLEKIKNPDKLNNIRKEFNLLYKSVQKIGLTKDSDDFKKLVNVNLKLWDIEDKIRIKEASKEFDDEFIQLARSVYFENDKRAEIKKQINLTFGSELVEEKEYVQYK
jgi:hypothetical protein